MGLIDINRNPSQKELKWFGLLLLLFSGIVGTVIWVKFDKPEWSFGIWAVALLVTGIFYIVPVTRRPLYLAWMYLFFPLSWTVSHLLFALTFYLVVTPIGLAMKLLGYDPMCRRWDSSADTYWREYDPAVDSKRYFRQF